MPSILEEIRRRRAGVPQEPEVHEEHQFDSAALRRAVDADQSLTVNQRKEMHHWLDDPAVLNELRSGSIGAALSLLISKFLDMKPRNQLLLSIAGFGIGKIIYDYKNDPKKFSRWNKQQRMYEIEH
jgi:hypothetical protein